MIARNFIAYLLQTPEKKRMPLVGQGAVVGQTGKTRAVERRAADACAWPAHRNPAAGRSRDEWIWMQLTVSSSGFCLLAVARCRLEGGPHMKLETRLQQAGWKTRQTMLKRNVH
jgi:hypothetical protein